MPGKEKNINSVENKSPFGLKDRFKKMLKEKKMRPEDIQREYEEKEGETNKLGDRFLKAYSLLLPPHKRENDEKKSSRSVTFKNGVKISGRTKLDNNGEPISREIEVNKSKKDGEGVNYFFDSLLNTIGLGYLDGKKLNDIELKKVESYTLKRNRRGEYSLILGIGDSNKVFENIPTANVSKAISKIEDAINSEGELAYNEDTETSIDDDNDNMLA